MFYRGFISCLQPSLVSASLHDLIGLPVNILLFTELINQYILIIFSEKAVWLSTVVNVYKQTRFKMVG